MPDTLPEGTDQIIPGAANNAKHDTSETETKPETSGFDTSNLRGRAADKAGEVKGQVSEKAMAFAASGKVRAAGALDEMARMIGDTAGRIDEQIGGNYGDYARRAADAVSGASNTLRDKDVDELLEDARELIRKSPALAVGAAAAAGFALARIIKAGSEALDAAASTSPEAPKTGAKAKPVTDA